jgi:hypothetical protein
VSKLQTLKLRTENGRPTIPELDGVPLRNVKSMNLEVTRNGVTALIEILVDTDVLVDAVVETVDQHGKLTTLASSGGGS